MKKNALCLTTRFVLPLAMLATSATGAGHIDLSRASIALRQGASEGERVAATVLSEEVEKRTGLKLPVGAAGAGPSISLSISAVEGLKAEGYSLRTAPVAQQAAVEITGADGRGVLFGVGAFLRKAAWGKGRLSFASGVAVASSPAYPIRGHQIGYRSTANSWDAWTVEQFDQYFRELALFGVNSIENIPFQDPRNNPLMKVGRREMNIAMSAICKKYGLDYWVWTPADIDLKDTAKRDALLAKFDELFADSVELTGVFVPGGDPGDNPPELVMPLLEEIAKRMAPRFPKAKIWLSLQGFEAEKEEAVYKYIEGKMPVWLGGLVHGPSSPPLARTRMRLPAKYRVRLYPDLTHNKICQYQVPELDQAIALTLGREAVNPRPVEFAAIHNRYARASDGFISYSDGVHDDVNKAVWSAMAWDPKQEVREVVADYARLHFDSSMAGEIADAILALERNWRGPLVTNGSVEATLREWQRLERAAPQLDGNWRWQMNQLRAMYDAFIRRRLIRETGLEAEANKAMARAGATGAGEAMDAAAAILNRAVTEPESPELRARIVELCEMLFQSIRLQTSVEKYHASGAERGAVLDHVDYPMNNRWWLEDEFQKIRAMGDEAAKVKRLKELAAWENPGEGSFYDDIGNVAKSLHVDGDQELEADSFRGPEPTFWWWDQGKSRARLSWQTTMWPKRMVYEGLDPNARYVVRTTGYGKGLLSVDGVKVTPSVDGKLMGEYKEFPVPAEQVKDRRVVLIWEIPSDEEHLNWRQRSRLAEVWLLKKE